jgi:hypothetical protein
VPTNVRTGYCVLAQEEVKKARVIDSKTTMFTTCPGITHL